MQLIITELVINYAKVAKSTTHHCNHFATGKRTKEDGEKVRKYSTAVEPYMQGN